MGTGAITEQIDVAQLVLVAFFAFFAGLVVYLRREDKREGYPLEDPGPRAQRFEGWPPMPAEKVYPLMGGGTTHMPHPENEPAAIDARPLFGTPGDPLQPLHSVLADAIGPAAWALKKTAPMQSTPGRDQTLPMRVLGGDWRVIEGDADPRGMDVVAADGVSAGVVRDLWIDRSVKILRYLELETADGRRALLPIYYADIRPRRGLIRVKALLARQFALVPALADPDRITAREEDQVTAFYAGGFFVLNQQDQGLLT